MARKKLASTDRQGRYEEQKQRTLAKIAAMNQRGRTGPRDKEWIEREVAGKAAKWAGNPRHCFDPEHHPDTRSNTNGWGYCLLCAPIRGLGRNKAKPATHCRRGHAFTPENTYHHPNGKRVCRICLNNSSKRHYAKIRMRRNAKARAKLRRGDANLLYWRNQIEQWWQDGIRPLSGLKSAEEIRAILDAAPKHRQRRARTRQLEKGDTAPELCGLAHETPHGRVAVESGLPR